MSRLDDARNIINQIDEQMVKLFEKRMLAVRAVAEYKKEQNLPIFDEAREKNLIAKNISMLENKELEEYYQIFFEGVLESSKSYQKDLIK